MSDKRFKKKNFFSLSRLISPLPLFLSHPLSFHPHNMKFGKGFFPSSSFSPTEFSVVGGRKEKIKSKLVDPRPRSHFLQKNSINFFTSFSFFLSLSLSLSLSFVLFSLSLPHLFFFFSCLHSVYISISLFVSLFLSACFLLFSTLFFLSFSSFLVLSFLFLLFFSSRSFPSFSSRSFPSFSSCSFPSVSCRSSLLIISLFYSFYLSISSCFSL
ncbi:unnamed protein product [Acanthosepion pharaonis]|uniref:Uncharacterized protein n=1 Tax=Acanthosepion pharaonis TaxID=158019 RepID=A0A812CF45_ACAPH|nr:unnamed protein product [Sepia pharaonis]